MLIKDIAQIVLSFIPSSEDQLSMHSSCKDFYELNITIADSRKLTDSILKQVKYTKLEILIAETENITDVNHLKNLTKLHCKFAASNIHQNSIYELTNLVELTIESNSNKIFSVNHLKNSKY